MGTPGRISLLCLVASYLTVASLPCLPVSAPSHPAAHHGHAPGVDRAPADDGHHGAHSAASHAQHRASPDREPSSSLHAPCPCGCEGGAVPGGGSARTGPALLLATADPFSTAEPAAILGPDLRPTQHAPAPPDHVPLAA